MEEEGDGDESLGQQVGKALGEAEEEGGEGGVEGGRWLLGRIAAPHSLFPSWGLVAAIATATATAALPLPSSLLFSSRRGKGFKCRG